MMGHKALAARLARMPTKMLAAAMKAQTEATLARRILARTPPILPILKLNLVALSPEPLSQAPNQVRRSPVQKVAASLCQALHPNRREALEPLRPAQLRLKQTCLCRRSRIPLHRQHRALLPPNRFLR